LQPPRAGHIPQLGDLVVQIVAAKSIRARAERLKGEE